MRILNNSRDAGPAAGDPVAGIPGNASSGPLRGNTALEAEGWERRYLADPDRAREAVELYSSMGFEVRAEKLEPADFGPQCGDCSQVVCRSYVLIYTRKRGEPATTG